MYHKQKQFIILLSIVGTMLISELIMIWYRSVVISAEFYGESGSNTVRARGLISNGYMHAEKY